MSPWMSETWISSNATRSSMVVFWMFGMESTRNQNRNKKHIYMPLHRSFQMRFTIHSNHSAKRIITMKHLLSVSIVPKFCSLIISCLSPSSCLIKTFCCPIRALCLLFSRISIFKIKKYKYGQNTGNGIWLKQQLLFIASCFWSCWTWCNRSCKFQKN